LAVVGSKEGAYLVAWISLEGISVEFPIYSTTGRSLKKRLLRVSTGGRISNETGRIVVHALNDVSLKFDHGDRVGLVGHNGAGKTTLLRVLAGVYEPTAGVIRSEGRITPLFDVSLGIDVEATGTENIYLRGALLGLTRRELDKKRDEIATFTELGDYMSAPVRTYSAGMSMRLAFAISTSIVPEILLMDENIAAGDAHFIHKAERRLNEIVERSGIMVLASHSEDLIERLCNRAVWMDAGMVRAVGRPQEILTAYRESTRA
jgi:ABC-type polysaccharide/polyol phosphate transport system ATPase subunit